jgi:hypothetical protein
MKLKLTAPDYYLPQIEATMSAMVMESGTTKPMLIKGIDIMSGERGKYVVKFVNSTRMTASACARELLGAWIGTELGLNMIESVLVNVTQDFVNTLRGQDGFLAAQNSIGLNFGSKYVVGYSELVVGRPIPRSIDNELLKEIFAFDMFISNADRGAGKPNLLTNGKDFLLFDHELAFSFIYSLPFLRNKTPWIFGDAERDMFKKHYFYNYLKGTNIDFEAFTEQFRIIDDQFWSKALSLIPEAWQTDELQVIKDYLKLISDNHKTFSEELKRILL